MKETNEGFHPPIAEKMAQDRSTATIRCLEIFELRLLIASFCGDGTLAAFGSASKWLQPSLHAFLYQRNVKDHGGSSIWEAILRYKDERHIIAVIESARRENADLGSRYFTNFDTLSHRGQIVGNKFEATALYAAAVMGRPLVLDYLLAKGVDIYQETFITVPFDYSRSDHRVEQTALYGALWAKQPALATTIYQASLNNMKRLSQKLGMSLEELQALNKFYPLGGYPNIDDSDLQLIRNHQWFIRKLCRTYWPDTGIHIAAAANALDFLLLMDRAEVDASCAFTLAVNASCEEKSIVDDLIRLDFDVNMESSPWPAIGLVRRPLAQACVNGRFDIALALVRAGARIYGEFPLLDFTLTDDIVNDVLPWQDRDDAVMKFAQEVGARSRAKDVSQQCLPEYQSDICPNPDSTFRCFINGVLSPQNGYPGMALRLLASEIVMPRQTIRSVFTLWRQVKENPEDGMKTMFPKLFELMNALHAMKEQNSLNQRLVEVLADIDNLGKDDLQENVWVRDRWPWVRARRQPFTRQLPLLLNSLLW
jgi:hypothetical protein